LTTDHDAHPGRVDKDSFIHVPGRASDLNIRGGNNIDAVVIEHVLLAHPEVTGANAVGRPDPCSGEAPVAYVTLRDGSTSTGRTIRDWVSGRISQRAAAPTEVTIVGVPDNQHLRTAISVALDRYPLRWRFSEAQR
jgi:fatty-acyl-CoA synthase